MRLIDADELKKDIARLHVLNDEAEIRRAYEYNPHVTSTDFEETLVSVFYAIDDVPSIDIEPKRGEWKFVGSSIEMMWECPFCGEHTFGFEEHLPNYCSNCGADMREREGE